MSKYLSGGDIPIQCLNCGTEFKVHSAALEKDPGCPACGTTIDAQQAREAMADVDKRVDEIKKAFDDANSGKS